jgi:hypothetical protein
MQLDHVAAGWSTVLRCAQPIGIFAVPGLELDELAGGER